MIESEKFFEEAMSFWKSGRIIQHSPKRFKDEQFLSAPIVYLYRHAVELLLKALIIRDGNALYAEEITTVLLPPHNKPISSLHSLLSLYEDWNQITASLLIAPADKKDRRELSRIIRRIEECDKSSTFFRYPYDRHGTENRKEFVEEVSRKDISSLPCCIGAIVSHEGPENFRAWHGDENISWLELDLDRLFVKLSFYYTGKQLLVDEQAECPPIE